jgi:hypothetical protein
MSTRKTPINVGSDFDNRDGYSIQNEGMLTERARNWIGHFSYGLPKPTIAQVQGKRVLKNEYAVYIALSRDSKPAKKNTGS